MQCRSNPRPGLGAISHGPGLGAIPGGACRSRVRVRRGSGNASGNYSHGKSSRDPGFSSRKRSGHHDGSRRGCFGPRDRSGHHDGSRGSRSPRFRSRRSC
ncbi:MAG: hypothetical protein M3017_12875, partial [Actinomycetota bacterium]|nr:hypothetical protein [Actinomycetota bacterium]